MSDLLCEAAASGDIQKIKALITESKVDPNKLHSKNKTPPIAWAAENGQLDAMKTLVELGANIHYEPAPGGVPLIVYAVINERKNWELMLAYLQSQGISLDPTLHILKGEYNSGKGCSLLWLIANRSRWNLLAHLLINNKLPKDMSIAKNMLISAQWDKNNEHHSSILRLVAQNGSDEIKTLISNHIFVRQILTCKPESFDKLIANLEWLINNINGDEVKLGYSFTKLASGQIELFKTCYIKIRELILNTNHTNNLNKLPHDARLLIAKQYLSSCFPGIQEEFISGLINLFDQFANVEIKKQFQTDTSNLVKLIYRSWRREHQDLFLFKSPKKNAIKDTYDCIQECLEEKLPVHHISSELRERVMLEINKLDKENFNKRRISYAIDEAIIECRKKGILGAQTRQIK